MKKRRHRADGERMNKPLDVEVHALQIAVEVAAAWRTRIAPRGPAIPLGVVATIAAGGLLVDRPDHLAKVMMSASPGDFVGIARGVWGEVFARRPDLAQWAYLLLDWLYGETDERLRRRIKRTAEAALRAGQLELTTGRRRFTCDLLGPVLAALRSRPGLKVDTRMYAPSPTAWKLTAVSLRDLEPGRLFRDDAVGTGGLFRATAEVVRCQGLDPADMRWFGADSDELAVAATAINALIWELGPEVFFYAGDVRAFPHWPDEAERQRAWFLEQVGSVNEAMALLDYLKEF
ncbi:hypothetical protein Amsp01_049960 [Amycolatopsis sp. NBRC 101858]|uniref:SAM-dependent DNA methyltransferase n=1 Tax=Amycolatopsis sp. NBRC 101858 TaxID=3032200 RepID=UPI0024A58CB5|nr:SAM-dependent DNA methyltransferase [Amycolatopsis sp. NBRC 101858]GLY38972.1 hypothetical protein Amsp01_049960 [Amycolatopsis sp. NBRC 101858]